MKKINKKESALYHGWGIIDRKRIRGILKITRISDLIQSSVATTFTFRYRTFYISGFSIICSIHLNIRKKERKTIKGSISKKRAPSQRKGGEGKEGKRAGREKCCEGREGGKEERGEGYWGKRGNEEKKRILRVGGTDIENF